MELSVSTVEVIEKLRRLSGDEEITTEARIALARACDAGLGPTELTYLMFEAYAVRAGLETGNHLCRVIDDVISAAT